MIKTTMSLVLLWFSPLLMAMPSLTNRCGEKGVQFSYPDNTTAVAFDENCRTAFIGPPLKGRVSVSQVMGSTNLLFCDTVKLLPKTVEATRRGIQFWADRIAQKSEEYDEVRKSVEEYSERLSRIEPQLLAKKSTLQFQQEELDTARVEFSEIKAEFDDCLASATEEHSCSEFAADLQKAKQMVSSKRASVSATKMEIIELESRVRTDEGAVNEINERLTQLMFGLEQYKSLLKGIENDALDGYQRYGQLYGATATVNFHSDWSALIYEAQQRNQSNQLFIEQLPLVATHVGISSAIPEGFSIKHMSTLLGARVPGFEVLVDKQPERVNLDPNMSLNPNPWTTTLTGQLDFNLIGACTMVNDKNEIVHELANTSIGSVLAINLQHTYPIMMKRSYTISFDTEVIASEMERQAESGGFLSSRKVHEIARTHMTGDTFDIKFQDEGGHTRYTDEEKKQITDDAKYEIMDRILSNMNAIPQYTDERPPVPHLERSSGVRFIYRKAPCFGYMLCHAAGFILGVVDAIVGSGESMAKFKNINRTRVTHRYSSESPGYLVATSTFIP